MMAERLPRRAMLARVGAGLSALTAVPVAATDAAPSVFGLADHARHYLVDTGAGAVFEVGKSGGSWSRLGAPETTSSSAPVRPMPAV
ncbi:hypothetical protein [Kutzneria sp. NPDC051319]|uniref:hypothetical protein n=1 Tax=Kutzneria sp. NPDC051319 TaxID=3155047 RepID=UPI00342520AD